MDLKNKSEIRNSAGFYTRSENMKTAKFWYFSRCLVY